ncbi:chitobiase/beta-hexosaminidase C-terminal domain-containing protein [Nibrella viscosa]|uniref:Chitobiase/beta-hexosaminidase C-terminal domain-containing protein n=1 Tax=Nibrella viscosa TaxID=1084524 RepID=A0ABP8KHN0_9BACT
MAEQVLFATAVFSLVLLAFNDKVVVPVWLQSVGRMHPLLLHFPLVLLLLALGLEIFRFKPANRTNDFYQGFLNGLWLAGALSAGITVIMGLFLSREEGYSGSALQWHKWSGAGVFFLSALLYWSRNRSWYTAGVAQTSAVFGAGLLVVSGHLGATVTHGDNFVWEPIAKLSKPEPVPLEQAVVFDHVIQPIFEQKCVSCHNAEKLKGGLMLTNAESVRKGGKTGRLFVAGKPETSLLLQRIHLPEEEKKHMPPKGKAQLTDNEIALLSLWVKGKADFKQKVVDLPPSDTLRRIAAALFKPAEDVEVYAFDAADEETVQQLSNNYRTILPLAKDSPALAVYFFNQNQYAPEKLKELKDIRQQVVSLSLNKMPVRDADLATVGQFENLRKLDINFTNITGAGLKALAGLKHLTELALSGTRITYSDLPELLRSLPSLKTVALWETQVKPADIQQLQKAYSHITFIGGFRGDEAAPIKLNPPLVKNSSVIFNQPLTVQLGHPVKGVQIRYTTDGTEPDSINSPLFTGNTLLTESADINAKAYKEGWYGSNAATFHFYKTTYKPDSVNLLLPLNRVHQADGAKTFFDGKLGVLNANSPAWANNWAGVRNNDLSFVSEFKTPVTVKSVALRTMVESETGIFPPTVIEIWGGPSREQMKLITTYKPAQPQKVYPPEMNAYEATFKPQTLSYLKIVAKPVEQLPEWHNNKGKRGLLLVDEVFIN